jgi:hypothetical protein
MLKMVIIKPNKKKNKGIPYIKSHLAIKIK